MFTRIILPILAALGMILGIYMVFMSRRTPPTPPIEFPPPVSPFKHSVAGAGIAEAATEDIAIGSPFGEIVEKVYVEAGDYVTAGAPLFKLDTRTLEKELDEAQAAHDVAIAKYQKTLALPRPEEVPILEAKVKQAEADYSDKKLQFTLYEEIPNERAISKDLFNQREFASLAALYALQETQANLDLLLAGAWVKDLDISHAEVKEAQARVGVALANLEKATIRAPFDGVAMRVDINRGEYASIGELDTPLILFGALEPLHIRVNIDEEDTWRVLPGAPGIAFVRGNSTINVPLEYVRLEPYLVPKRALTGSTTEQVDTRVLQLIYRFKRDSLPIWPGQIMDVYLEAKPNLGAS